MKLFWKRVWGQVAVARIAPTWPVNAALPVIKVQVNGVWCSALVDTGCSRSIVRTDVRHGVDMQTIDGTSWACSGVGTMSILTDGGGHAEVNIMLVHERPLSYDLLIGIDTIRALGGVTITPAGEVKLGGGKEACVDLTVSISKYLWPRWLGLQNTLTASLQRGKTPSMSVLDMTLNNLIVRLQ